MAFVAEPLDGSAVAMPQTGSTEASKVITKTAEDKLLANDNEILFDDTDFETEKTEEDMAGETQAVTDEMEKDDIKTDTDSHSEEAVSEEGKVDASEVAEETQAVTEVPLGDGQDVVSEVSETDALEVSTDASEVVTDAPEIITDAPEVITDAPEVVTDAPEVVTDAPEVGTDAPEMHQKL